MGRGKDRSYAEVVIRPLVCPNSNCSSTERTRYERVAAVIPRTVIVDGEEYQYIVKRPCKCKECGQAIMVTTYANSDPRIKETSEARSNLPTRGNKREEQKKNSNGVAKEGETGKGLEHGNRETNQNATNGASATRRRKRSKSAG